MPNVPLEPVDSVTVTTLVDNVTDMLLQDQGPAKRPRLGDPRARRLPAALLEGGETLGAPLREHGFAGAPPVPTTLPVILPPEFWSRRRTAIPGREPFEMPSTSKSALRGAGFEIVEEKQPSFLLDGSLLITGEVDRTTDFERGFPIHQAFRDGAWQPDPLILDYQAVVGKGADRGLVVST